MGTVCQSKPTSRSFLTYRGGWGFRDGNISLWEISCFEYVPNLPLNSQAAVRNTLVSKFSHSGASPPHLGLVGFSFLWRLFCNLINEEASDGLLLGCFWRHHTQGMRFLNSSMICSTWPPNTLQAFKDFGVIRASSAMEVKPAQAKAGA